MTTANKFFNKLFDENEKVKDMYRNQNFTEYDNKTINFLDKLSIISKYKKYFKSILLKRKISDRDKVNYIISYKAAMTYPEYIKFNIVTENHEKNFLSMLYIIGSINIFTFFYFLIKKPIDYSITKEMTYSFFFSLLCGYGFRKYSKMTYSAELSDLYLALEERMNHSPDLKFSMNNPNFMTEESEDEQIGAKI